MATVGRMCNFALKSKNLAASPLLQFVRYRKPRWLPIAKSKEFYVREPTPIDPDENSELKLRYAHYRATVRSIRQYLKKEMVQSKQDDSAIQNADESVDIAWMEQQCQEWNKKIAGIREERQLEEEHAENVRLQQLMSQREQRLLEDALEADRLLQHMKNISQDLITEENLDQEIEKMLDGRSDYNYALTRDGKILEGENPTTGNTRL